MDEAEKIDLLAALLKPVVNAVLRLCPPDPVAALADRLENPVSAPVDRWLVSPGAEKAAAAPAAPGSKLLQLVEDALSQAVDAFMRENPVPADPAQFLAGRLRAYTGPTATAPSGGTLVEAKSQLQVVAAIEPGKSHDELFEGILQSMASEAGRLGLPTPPRGADFAALRDWNKGRVKTEMADIIRDVAALEGKTPTALFVVGHSASGKSTFINQVFLPDQQGAFFYINPDVLGQFFCGSHKTFVDMKKHNLMSGDANALDSAHADLNGVRFTFVSQETMKQKKQAVLDSNTVPPPALDAWRKQGYDVRVAFVEASYQGSTEVADEKAKIELKVAHGLENDGNRVRKGEHSNRSLITTQRLTDCRKAAAKLHLELGCEVSVYISSGAAGKGQKGYMNLGTIGGHGLPLDEEFGFLTTKELPDGKWQEDGAR